MEPNRTALRPTEIVSRLREGEIDAEVELLQHYGRGVRLLLGQRVGSAALVRDLFQETFRIVLMRLRSKAHEPPASLAGFFRQTVVNVALLDHHRHASAPGIGISGVDLDIASDVLSPALDHLAPELLRDLVDKALNDLPGARERDLLWRGAVLLDDIPSLCMRFRLNRTDVLDIFARARRSLRAELDLSPAGARWRAGRRTEAKLLGRKRHAPVAALARILAPSFDRIGAYVAGALGSDDAARFEEQILDIGELREEVELHLALRSGLEALGAVNLGVETADRRAVSVSGWRAAIVLALAGAAGVSGIWWIMARH